MTCKHLNFNVHSTVNRIEDVGRFSVDVRVVCGDCGVPFRFIGLPAGLDLNGATVSADATEGRFAIAPKDEVGNALEGGKPIGFSFRKRLSPNDRI